MRNLISFRKKQGRFFSASTVSGDTTVGSVLTATNGVFTGPTPTYTYQWFLEGSPIPGATGSTYTIPALSNGILRCVVKATNSQGSVKSTSNFFTIRNSFDFVVKTDNISTGSSTAAQFKLPFVSNGIYNCTVYWGDGTSDIITAWDQAQTTHTYATAGTYNVSITGTCNGWRFANAGDRLKLLSVGWWGVDFRLGATDQHFNGCANLVLSGVRDVLDLTGTTSFASSFARCTRLTDVRNMNSWNTTNITSLNSTFRESDNFNANIGSWDIKNVTNLSGIFTIPSGRQGKFNQNIGNWNTSKVTTMQAMLTNQAEFNQDISTKEVTVNGVTYTAWDTLNVTDMGFALAFNANVSTSDFNQNIGNWNTSKVTAMNQMFQNNTKFNQDISTKVVTVGGVTYTAWDTLNVTTMSGMFGGSRTGGIFNQNIGNWNTSKVTSLQNFISKPNFNQDISTKIVTVGASTYTAWDTLNVTAMANMFNVSSLDVGKFNQNIGNWNTSKVTNMSQAFGNQINFNQDISTKVVTVGASTYTAWDTLNVTAMNYLLYLGLPQIGKFNQNIGNWNTAKVTTMIGTFQNQTAFNQPIDNWNVSLVTSFTFQTLYGFMQGKTFEDYSSANYDALLIGWSSRPVQPNLAINFGTIKYSSASIAARAILTSAPNNWTIVDGGLI